MTAPNRRHHTKAATLAALESAAGRVHAARDREARRRAEDAIDSREQRHLHDLVVGAEIELLCIASTLRVRCRA